jgi:hypothetical protein
MARSKLALVALTAALLSILWTATGAFDVAPAPAAQSVAGMNRGTDGYDAILEAMEQVGNVATVPVATAGPQSGQTEYDQILTALEMASGVVTVNAIPIGGGPA